MELELGFKISKTLDDYSSTKLRISKDRAGPVFVSRETDTMFVLNGHLKGYKKDRIQIDVNEDGTRIAIKGERPVQEMVMIKWQMQRKEPEMRGFKKVFNIPEGVKLNKIKARFNEDESLLTISMPKLMKGLVGLKLREITEEDPMQKENDKSSKESDASVSEISPIKHSEKEEQVDEEANNIVSKEIPPNETGIQGLELNNLIEASVDEGDKGKNSVEQQEIPPKETEIQGLELDKLKEKRIAHQEQEEQDEGEKGKNSVEQQEISLKETEIQGLELDNLKEESSAHQEQVREEKRKNIVEQLKFPPEETEAQGPELDRLKEKSIGHQEQEEQDGGEKRKNIVEQQEISSKQAEIQGLEEEQDEGEKGKNIVEQQENEDGQLNKLCLPMIAGTAFIMSLIVFVMHMIRAKSSPSSKNK